MKGAYPIVLTQVEKAVLVYIPDFDINTEGKDLANAIEMARDAIGMMGIDMEDDKETIPVPSKAEDISKKDNEMITLVDVDFNEYRRKNDIKTVRKNCTLPSWLCYEAEQAGVNFSAVLQTALKEALGLSGAGHTAHG